MPERSRRMCPNEACEKYGQPTGIMGGCDCGTALVPFKTQQEIDDEALWALLPDSTKRLITYAIIGGRHAR